MNGFSAYRYLEGLKFLKIRLISITGILKISIFPVKKIDNLLAMYIMVLFIISYIVVIKTPKGFVFNFSCLSYVS